MSLKLNTASSFLNEWGKYMPEGTLARETFEIVSENKDIDYGLIDAILENVSQKDATDCLSLLLFQNVDVFDKIYERMFDVVNGNYQENNYIPINFSYDQLEKIILENGGKKETFGCKRQNKLKQQIKNIEAQIAEAKRKRDIIIKECKKIGCLCEIAEMEALKQTMKNLNSFTSNVCKIKKEMQQQLFKELLRFDDEYLEKNGLFGKNRK